MSTMYSRSVAMLRQAKNAILLENGIPYDIKYESGFLENAGAE